VEECAHSAGYDSYATGYIFGHYLNVLGQSINQMSNKIYLAGSFPLTLCKSKYST